MNRSKWPYDSPILIIYDFNKIVKKKNARLHTGVEEIIKPVMIEDYNQYMGGVNLS